MERKRLGNEQASKFISFNVLAVQSKQTNKANKICG